MTFPIREFIKSICFVFQMMLPKMFASIVAVAILLPTLISSLDDGKKEFSKCSKKQTWSSSVEGAPQYKELLSIRSSSV